MFMPYSEVVLNNTSIVLELTISIKLAATVDIKVSAFADSVAVTTCRLSGWLEVA